MISWLALILLMKCKEDVEKEVKKEFAKKTIQFKNNINKITNDVVNPVLIALDEEPINSNYVPTNNEDNSKLQEEYDKQKDENEELKKANEELEKKRMKEEELLKREKELKEKEEALEKQIEETNNQKKDETLVSDEQIEKLDDIPVFPFVLLTFIPLSTLFMISVVVHILIFRVFFVF